MTYPAVNSNDQSDDGYNGDVAEDYYDSGINARGEEQKMPSSFAQTISIRKIGGFMASDRAHGMNESEIRDNANSNINSSTVAKVNMNKNIIQKFRRM
jgi:hypothetical protein